jgi:hypothetical protein
MKTLPQPSGTEVRLHVALQYLAGNRDYATGKDAGELLEAVQEIAACALAEWARAKIAAKVLPTEGAGKAA